MASPITSVPEIFLRRSTRTMRWPFGMEMKSWCVPSMVTLQPTQVAAARAALSCSGHLPDDMAGEIDFLHNRICGTAGRAEAIVN